jgi:hypothetical protein
MLRYVCGRAGTLALVILSILVVGCAKTNSAGGLGNPSSRLASITSDYPGVGMVILPGGTGLCTGTAVGVSGKAKAVITAAHCTLDSSPGGVYTFQTGSGDSYTTSFVYHAGSGTVDSTDDMAILVFPDGINVPTYGLGDQVQSGDTLTLVGYGCNNITTKGGAGVKRMGTNQVSTLGDFINFETPQSSSSNYAIRKILGPDNMAGSCFGDSGGPAFANSNGTMEIVGLTHAGGPDGNNLLSEYVNVATNSSNRAWLSSINTQFSLHISGL